MFKMCLIQDTYLLLFARLFRYSGMDGEEAILRAEEAGPQAESGFGFGNPEDRIRRFKRDLYYQRKEDEIQEKLKKEREEVRDGKKPSPSEKENDGQGFPEEEEGEEDYHGEL
jgi:hypothetical protein